MMTAHSAAHQLLTAEEHPSTPTSPPTMTAHDAGRAAHQLLTAEARPVYADEPADDERPHDAAHQLPPALPPTNVSSLTRLIL